MSESEVSSYRDLLGEIVCWDMPGAEVPLRTVEQALLDAGLPHDALSEMRLETAFKRSLKDLRENRSIDKIVSDRKSGVATFQFTQKHLEESGLLDFEFECKVDLDTSTGQIDCDVREIEDHARTMFAHCLSHRTTSDITRAIRGLFEAHADLFPINGLCGRKQRPEDVVPDKKSRAKGVAYFVPVAHHEFTDRVEGFLKRMGGNLGRFPVPVGTAEGNRSVRMSVEAGLEALTDELEHAIEDWNERTREGTFDKAVERWQILKHKAEAYSEYLGDRQQDLIDRLNVTKQRLAQRVQELTESATDATETPATTTERQVA